MTGEANSICPEQHIEGQPSKPNGMEARGLSAIFLVAVMALAGCLGATEPAPVIEEPESQTFE